VASTAAAAAPPAAPIVEVTIGRVEVRAVTAPSASPRRRTAPTAPSLDDYLRARGGRS
jgi:hypothetical protein